MEVTIVAAASAPHQQSHAVAIQSGLRKHGVKCSIRASYMSSLGDADVVVVWGWKNAIQHRSAGKNVMIIERGYIGDRFAWTSLGWNGLNGKAIMPDVDDSSRFLRLFPDKLEPLHSGGEYSLVIGQVPTDASLAGRDLTDLYRDSLIKAEAFYGLPAWFRPHPRARHSTYAYPNIPRKFWREGDLQQELMCARSVITFNSNTAVESVLAGVPTVTNDDGSMAWQVSSHKVGEEFAGNREDWAYHLAWKQWSLEEIENGLALSHLLPIMPAASG